jgi:signal transduction histidine kinase
VVLLAGVLPLLVSVAAHLIIGDAKHVQEPLHEGFELVGCCIALSVAMILLLSVRHENASPHLLWVVAALVAMGIVDGVHSFLPTGVAFSWTRHGATLVGGVFFALVWLPLPAVVVRRKQHFLFLLAVLAMAGSFAIWCWPERLPAPWVAGNYSRLVIATNALGGLGFLAAAVFFIRRYLREPRGEDLVFASHTLLFGTASLFFGFSHVWGADWWVWHGARLLAYSVVLVAVYDAVVTLYRQIAQLAQERLIANEDLRTEVVERQRVEVEVARWGEEQARLNLELTRSNRATLNLMQDAVQAKSQLEQRVKERTVELEAVNRELEAFSYSVSHDLKAPLRSVDGFVRILEQEYAARLDDEGRRLLHVVRDSAQDMGRLINDLLTFSRLSRKDLKMTRIKMNDMAQDARRQVEAGAAGRVIRWEIGDLPVAFGDEAMIHEVLVNLLSNAVKFTRPRQEAVIAVEGRVEGDEVRYAVTDNGVGFDMAYQDKLFCVFQRLHTADEFEGTGIGLALVQRIVQRHGGKVWAQGKVGQGATFGFRLPGKGNMGSGKTEREEQI